MDIQANSSMVACAGDFDRGRQASTISSLVL
jgi:hypothetical protein